MSSRDFGYITLRNIAAYQRNGNPVPPNQVLVTSGNGTGGFTNSLIISTICVSTVEVSTIFIQNEFGSTINTNYLTVNSTSQLSSIFVNGQSQFNGNVNVASTLTANGKIGAGVSNPSTFENLTVNSTLLILTPQNGKSRLVLGAAPNTNNYDYCSVIEANTTSANEGTDLRFYTHFTSPTFGMPDERMRIDNQGNVYIWSTLYVPYLNTNQISTSNVTTNFVSTFNHIALFDGPSTTVLEAGISTLMVNGFPVITGGSISSISSLFWRPGPEGTIWNENGGTLAGNYNLVGIGTNNAPLNATLDVSGSIRASTFLSTNTIQMNNGVINPGGSNLTLGGSLYVSSFAGNMAAANLRLFNGAVNFITNANFVNGFFIEVSSPYTTNFTDYNAVNTYASIGPAGITTNSLQNVSTLQFASNTGQINGLSTINGIAWPPNDDALWSGSLNGNIHNDNIGNVGIGTTNPLLKLTVDGGDVLLRGANSSTSRLILGQAPNQTNYDYCAVIECFNEIDGPNGGNESSELRFYTQPSGGTQAMPLQRMVIYSDGSVNIFSTLTASSFNTNQVSSGNIAAGFISTNTLQMNSGNIYTNGGTIYGLSGINNSLSGGNLNIIDTNITLANGSLTIPSANYYISTNNLNMTNGQITGLSSIYMTNGQIYSNSDVLSLTGNTDGEAGLKLFNGQAKIITNTNYNGMYLETSNDTTIILCSTNAGKIYAEFNQTNILSSQTLFLNPVGVQTTNPQFTVDVAGSIRASTFLSTAVINMSSLGTNNGQIIGLSTINGIAWPPVDDAVWSGSLNGNIYNDNIGNVAIGVPSASATEKLTVNSTMLIRCAESSTARLVLGASPNTNNYDYCAVIEGIGNPNNETTSLAFYTQKSGGTQTMPPQRMIIDSDGDVYIYSTLIVPSLNTNTIQMNNGVINPSGSNLTLGGSLYVSSFAGNIAAANLRLFNGAVNFVTNANFVNGFFIEVSSPYTTNFTDYNAVNTYASIGPSGITTNSIQNMSTLQFASNTGQINGLSTINGIAWPPVDDALWSKNNNNDIYNDNTGNVGINTTNPTNTLQIDGTFQVNNDSEFKPFRSAYTGNYIYVDNGSDFNNTRLGAYKISTIFNEPINLCLQTNTSGASVGRVGVGKLNPLVTLDVNGDIQASGYLSTNTIQMNSGNITYSNQINIDSYPVEAGTGNINLGTAYNSLITIGSAGSGRTHQINGNLAVGSPIAQNNFLTLYNTSSISGAPYNTTTSLVMSTSRGFYQWWLTNNEATTGSGGLIQDHLQLYSYFGSPSSIIDIASSGDTSFSKSVNVTGNLNVTGSNNIVQSGSIMMFSTETAPSGWILCDGAQYDKNNSLYTALFNVIGYKYGGSGNNFNVPNLQQRFPMGYSSGNNTIGNTGGQSTIQLSGSNIPQHTHNLTFQFYTNGDSGSGITYVGDIGTDTVTSGANYSTPGTPFNILPPYIVINYIIKL